MILEVFDEHSTKKAPARAHVTGPVWVEARTGLRRFHGLSNDILVALGKNLALSGKGRNANENEALISAWFAAQGSRDLVITQAQRLHPTILTTLARFARRAKIHLWLAHSTPTIEMSRKRIVDLADGSARYAPPPTPELNTESNESRPSSPNIAARDMHPLPRDLPFLNTGIYLSQFNDGSVGAFRTEVDDADRQISRTSSHAEVITRALIDLVTTIPEDTELLWKLRAYQLAAWRHSVLISVDTTQLLNSSRRMQIPIEAVDEALSAYRQPIRAVTVGLLARRIDLTTISALPAIGVTPSGEIDIPDHDLHLTPHVARALLAQRHLRAHSSDADDRLIPMTPPRLAALATEAATDLNIDPIGRYTGRTNPHRQLLRSLGITIETVA